MVRRKRLNSLYSRRVFSRTARKVHKKNLIRKVSRGGIRF
ncbi:DNA binding protein [Peromfec virus RodF8_53]|uniref:DNA binding protein n=1 Tax=Peromfec virus RodF8_53 TaxID=2929382 RepID=A0A976N1L6_9VIRU|nr:DNA binding protein [Peromfec virus RodF8_53]